MPSKQQSHILTGGMYKNCTTKPFDEKVRVAQKLIEMIRADPHSQPSIGALAKAAKVSRIFAGKILSKLREGLLVDPKTKLKNIP
jgi:hypothetical protein